MSIKERPGGMGRVGYISGRDVGREQKRLARVAALRECARIGDSLTAVIQAEGVLTVHLGFDHGSYNSYPLCGALENRRAETTEDVANCSRCATTAREIGLGHLLRDEDGWTGIYEPRRSNR